MVVTVQEIAEDAFSTALEILQIVELMERQNTGRINGNLTDSGAARAATTVRNCLIARLVILVAGAFSPVRYPGDKHLRQGFEQLHDPSIRGAAASAGSVIALNDAEQLWSQLNSDPRLSTIKHFRDKFTAHSAAPTPGVSPPQYGEMFGFAQSTASVMEKFAHGVGVTTELLSDTANSRIESTQIFWEPWEFLRPRS